MSVVNARAHSRSLSISTSSCTQVRSTTAMAVAVPIAPTPVMPSFMSSSCPVVRRASRSSWPRHSHKRQEGNRRPMRGEQTTNCGADTIDQKHPDLPLRGDSSPALFPASVSKTTSRRKPPNPARFNFEWLFDPLDLFAEPSRRHLANARPLRRRLRAAWHGSGNAHTSVHATIHCRCGPPLEGLRR
jgi:hypothetical protein